MDGVHLVCGAFCGEWTGVKENDFLASNGVREAMISLVSLL